MYIETLKNPLLDIASTRILYMWRNKNNCPKQRHFSGQFETLVFNHLESCSATVPSLILHDHLSAMSEYYTLILSLRTMKISQSIPGAWFTNCFIKLWLT